MVGVQFSDEISVNFLFHSRRRKYSRWIDRRSLKTFLRRDNLVYFRFFSWVYCPNLGVQDIAKTRLFSVVGWFRSRWSHSMSIFRIKIWWWIQCLIVFWAPCSAFLWMLKCIHVRYISMQAFNCYKGCVFVVFSDLCTLSMKSDISFM